MTKTLADYKKDLRRHLDFIRRSAALYDEGHHDEAGRIALCLRVLLHDTKNGTSLLTKMNSKNIKIASKTSDDAPILTRHPDMKGFLKTSMVLIGIGFCKPDLSPAHRFVDIPTWWNECIIAFPPDKFSRKDIILWAADKEIAHVDATLPVEYETLKADGAIGGLEFGGELKDIVDAHYMILRTMASEILESPELLALLT